MQQKRCASFLIMPTFLCFFLFDQEGEGGEVSPARRRKAPSLSTLLSLQEKSKKLGAENTLISTKLNASSLTDSKEEDSCLLVVWASNSQATRAEEYAGKGHPPRVRADDSSNLSEKGTRPKYDQVPKRASPPSKFLMTLECSPITNTTQY
jgi:hypothetical protein